MSIKCPKCQSENPDDTIYCGKCATPLKSPEDISVTKTLETPVKKLAKGTAFADRYEILEELGKGGMGEVYKVRDKKLDEDMALKVLRPEIATDKGMIERFRHELKIARKITHKHICRMYDLNEEEETPYITMEYVEGQDLKNHIKKEERLSTDGAVSIAKQVCEGLTEAHRLGVVHRDLKPQNIMIDKEGSAKIMDFGIARSVEAPGVTATGVIIGTPDYISPEQAEGEEADHRSDIYSLGVILFEMVTGGVPFRGDTALSVAIKHKTQLPSDPRKLNPQVSDDLSRLILICMEKDRERRYPTAEALLTDLKNIEEGFPLGTKIRPRRVTFTQTLIRNKLFIPTIVVILAIIAVAIWQLLPQKGAAYPPKIENSIAVISFENQTGDEALDKYQRSIPNLLITSLEQTDLFYVATWERMRDLLEQMGKDDVDIITSDLGFEACRREGVKALIQGSFTKIGETFATDIKVLDVDTKRLLSAATSKGEGEESIFAQIDELGKKISESMGISGQKVETTQTSIRDLTTNSIAAYDYYIKGKELAWKADYRGAIPHFKKAVELDPSFAMAYHYLGQLYDFQIWVKGAQVSELRDEAITRAKEYSSKATEKERLRIEADYALIIENDREKWLLHMEQLVNKYPREKEELLHLGDYYYERADEKALEMYNKALDLDPNFGEAHNQLGRYYLFRSQEFEKAHYHLKKQVTIYPNQANPLDSLAHCNFYLGRVDEALSNFKTALEIDPDFDQSMACIHYIYAFKEDYGEAIDSVDKHMAAHPTHSNRFIGNLWKGLFYSWIGRYDEGFDYMAQAKQHAESDGRISRILWIDFIKALICRERGQLELSRKLNESWYPLFKKEYPDSRFFHKSLYFWLNGLLDLQKGSLESAKSGLAEGKSLFSKISNQRLLKEEAIYFYNVLEGEILLAERLSDEAISLFQNEAPVMGPGIGNPIVPHNFPFTRDQLARAYQQKGDLDKAIQEYERLTSSDRTKLHYRLIHPLYYYRVALLYEQKGWKGKAIENYEKFLDLWKDADTGLPEVEDAKERLAGLKD